MNASTQFPAGSGSCRDVVIVDTGVANLASMRAAFSRLEQETRVACDAREVGAATHLVLPGVGAFERGMQQLRRGEWDRLVAEWTAQGRPLLAVCLGMQLLCEASAEAPHVPGLGILPGRVQRLPRRVRVPHMGWNGVRLPTTFGPTEPTATDLPGNRGSLLRDGTAAFANSYALVDPPRGWRTAITQHGRLFVSAVERGRVLACQFHPELSGEYGLGLLRRWLACGEGRPEASAGPIAQQAVGRLLPCLDVQDGRVVKGVRFQGLRDAGDPVERARRYEADGADELVLLDIAASPRETGHGLETVRSVRAVLGIALTVGGGVRSVDDATALLQAGADKVSLNSAAVDDPELLGRLADRFGRQCIVLAVDARRRGPSWEVLTHGGRRSAERDAVEWIRDGTALGAGEILLTSWDRDGTGDGADLELLRAARQAVDVPVIASGGVGHPDDAVAAFQAGADAVLAASIFHDGTYPVPRVKQYLRERGLEVRA